MEHRRGCRNTIRVPVKLCGRRCSAVEGEILDLSTGGAFIRLADKPPHLYTMLELSFTLPEPELKFVNCRALVVRNDKEGIGVMFAQRQNQLKSPTGLSTQVPHRRIIRSGKRKTEDHPVSQHLATH